MLQTTLRTLSRVCRGAAAPRRIRRTRGFGVHSPFAFRFIREVLDQPCAYYCYPRLEASSRTDGTNPRTAKALFRVALYFAPGPIAIIGPLSETLRTALTEAGSIVATGQTDFHTAKCIIGLPDGIDECKAMWESSERGMLFCAPEMAIFTRLSHLPHQSFDILLR